MHDTDESTGAVVVTVDGVRVALHLVEAGLACCAVEQSAATARIDALVGDQHRGAADAPGLPDLHVLVVSGTVTDAMAPLLVDTYRSMPEPRAALSFGACAATGGPYWDSPVVTNGIDQLLPVDVYVPGCPPSPDAFLSGLAVLVGPRGDAQ